MQGVLSPCIGVRIQDTSNVGLQALLPGGNGTKSRPRAGNMQGVLYMFLFNIITGTIIIAADMRYILWAAWSYNHEDAFDSVWQDVVWRFDYNLHNLQS